MSDSEVIVVSLAIGLAVGIVLIMVLWACKVCLGKPKTADDDHTALHPARRQPAVSAENAAAQPVNVELPARSEQARHESSATAQSPRVQRSHPPAAIQFPNEAIAPSPNLSVPSPEPGPTAPSPFSTKASPQIVLPSGPVAFASPSPLPTRLSNHGLQLEDTPSPQPRKPRAVDSSMSAGSSPVPAATAAPVGASTKNPPSPQPAATRSTAATSNPQSAVARTLAQLDPTVPSPTPMSGLLGRADPQDTVLSPGPSGVPSDVSVDPSVAKLGETGVPILNLGPLNDARAMRHNANAATYPDPSSSAIGTTAELGPMSDASVPNPPSAAPASYRMPAPLRTVSATRSLESQQAQVIAHSANQEASKTTAASIQSFHIPEEEPSTAVSDAAVTVEGLTMRELVDQPEPIEFETGADASYTAALEMATGVQHVEASFVTACEDDIATISNDADAEETATEEKRGSFMGRKQDMAQGLMSSSGTALLAHYEEVGGGEDGEEEDDEEDYESVGTPYTGLDTTRTVGAQSLAFMEGGQRYRHRPEARFVPEVEDLQGGRMHDASGMNDIEPSDLPPGAVMRGRDPLLDHLMSSKLSQELPDGFSRTTSTDMPTPGRNGAASANQSPLGTPGNTSHLSGLGGSTFSGAEQKSSMTLSDGYRFIPDSNQDSLLSIPLNPAMGFPGDTETLGHSVAISEASEWTLSAPTRAMGPSSALSRATGAPSRRYVPGYADSMMSGVSTAFSEASDWTLSGGNTRQMPALRGVGGSRRNYGHGMSPLPSPSTRSQLGQSNGLTSGLSTRSGASNWTLSGGTTRLGAPSQRFSHASRALDDGRSIAFTDGGSEWALSPRSTVVRDDLDVGHSERWMQPEEIKMPARRTPQSSHTRGLREKYEHKTLRQKYASDDANVPEYAVRRVNDWMGAMEGDSREEVMLRLTAQQNDY